MVDPVAHEACLPHHIPHLLYVFKMDMVNLGPLNLTEAVISTPDGMKACQDYGKAVGKKLQA